MIVSCFKDAFTSESPINLPIVDVLRLIKSGKWKDKVERLRSLPIEEYKKQKLFLPAVTFSGIFNQRLDKQVAEYSRLMIIDIDNLESELLINLSSLLKDDEYTYAMFISPSGNGLKVLFKLTNDNPDRHKAYFSAIQKHFEENYAVLIDKSGKNISRLCFVSYDEELYINENSKEFDCPGIIERFPQKQYRKTEELKNANPDQIDPTEVLRICCKWTDKHYNYVEGERNTYLHSLCCAMNRVGVEMDDTIEVFLNNFDLPIEEVDILVKGVYFRNRNEFGTYPLDKEQNFKRQDYSSLLTDNEVLNDFAEIIKSVYTNTVSREGLLKILTAYIKTQINDGFINITREETAKFITETIKKIDEVRLGTIGEKGYDHEDITQLAEMYAKASNRSGEIRFHLGLFDNFDLLMPECFYGMVGMPRTFKSVLATHLVTQNAKNDIPCLYLSGEMSRGQMFERLSTKECGINWKMSPHKEKLADANFVAGVGEMIDQTFKKNLFIVTLKDFNRENIVATVNKIEIKTGKKIKLIVLDGLSEMDWLGREEIQAAIFNCREAKEIAKDTGCAVIGLMHTSGRLEKYYRNTSAWVRGANKTIASMDGIFMNSLIVHPETNNLQNDDIMYYQDKFFLRFEDKRGNAGTVDSIVSVDDRMRLSYLDSDTNKYEVKINKQ
jgi:hypothetical protein